MRFLTLGAVFLLACSGGGDDNATSDGGDGGSPSNDGMMANDTPADTGLVLCNGVTCGANEVCLNDKSCVCAPTFVPNGSGGCVSAPANSPGSHTEADVCAMWTSGHVITTPNPYTAGSTMCDPGTLAAGGITDTLVRINAFRWLTGLGNMVTDSATDDTGDQDCSIIAIWNPASLAAHHPPTSSTCYNSNGATWAGMSNISWGLSAPSSIDAYIQDQGNESSLGHRRWVLHPPLGIVGVGYVKASGTMYGQAGCLGVFDTSGTGPEPMWYAWPPEGFIPATILTGTTEVFPWSFHFPAGMTSATATVMDMGTASMLTVTTLLLPSGYGDDAFENHAEWVDPNGWRRLPRHRHPQRRREHRLRRRAHHVQLS